MSDRIRIQRHKQTPDSYSYPKLATDTQGLRMGNSQASVNHEISRISLRPQARLTVSQPEDFYEQEADRVTQHHVVQQGGGIKINNTQQEYNNTLTASTLMHRIQNSSGVSVQCKEQDPDELATTAKEDANIEANAKSALQSGNHRIGVFQVVWKLIQNHRLDTNSQLSGVSYEQTKKGIEIKFSGKDARTQGSIVAGDEVLQRVANRKTAEVVKEIETQIRKVDTARGTIDYVFIMGVDKPKSNNKFYTEAKKFFKTEYPNAVMVEDARNLDGINQRINAGGKPVANLYIVSHAHADGTLSFSLNPSDKTPGQVDYSEIKKANEENSLTKPKEDLVGFWTNVMIRGCNLGRSEKMLEEVKSAFGGKARVMAPTHAQRYGNGKESMAGPFYEEPGNSKLTDNQAFEKIKSKPEYAFITDWKAMRKTLRRTNEIVPYTLEISYESAADVTPDAVNSAKNQAIAEARDDVSRPDAYTYTVRPPQKTPTKGKGMILKIVVDARRTEWVLYHAEIHKQGKGFNPSSGTKPWFGDTK
jgi:hypothetical protein